MNYFSDFFQNLRLAYIGPYQPEDVRVSPAQIVTAIVFMCVAQLAHAAYRAWPVSHMDYWSGIAISSSWFLILAVIAIGLLATARGALLSVALVMVPMGFAIMWLTAIALEFGLELALGPERYLRFFPALNWIIIGVAAGTVLAHLLNIMGFRFTSWLRIVPIILVLLASQVLVSGYYGGPIQPFQTAWLEEDGEETYAPHVDVETIYTFQESIRHEQWDDMPFGIKGQSEAFALVLGGTAHQDVFASEVENVSAILDETYGTGSRTIRLLNSTDTPQKYPLANRDNLNRALHHLARRMNPEEDWAFLYLTSHGSRDLFSLTFWQTGTHSLPAEQFSHMLEQSGIRNLVIVLSACYSGSFIDDIEAPDRIIITASAADRTSFGCADGREWTYWGDALFGHALKNTSDIRQAFDEAKALVTEWELADGHKPSDPQIAVGADMADLLDGWSPDQPRAHLRN